MNKLLLILVCFVSSAMAAEEVEAMTAEWKQSVDNALPYVLEEYGECVRRAADEFQLSAWLGIAIIVTKTHGDPNAVSSSGAVGLMQIKPATRDYIIAKLPKKHFEKNLKDACNNIRLAYGYLHIVRRDQAFAFETPEEMAAAYYMGHNGANRIGERERFNHWYPKKVMYVALHPDMPNIVK